MGQELQHASSAIPGALAIVGDPAAIVAQHQKIAKVLVEMVRQNKWEVSIAGRKHIMVEAWQALGYFYGVTGKVSEVEPYVDEITGAAGFRAHAETIKLSDGQVVGSGFALCLNNEENWNERPKYEKNASGQRVQVSAEKVPTFQLNSMAQTRAIGKALRGNLAFVVALAGYDPTPAEEMTGNEARKEKAAEPSNGNGSTNRISDPQRKRLFAIAHEASCPTNNLVLLFQRKYGFNQAFEITKDKYDAIVEDVRNWQKIPEAQPIEAKEGAK